MFPAQNPNSRLLVTCAITVIRKTNENGFGTKKTSKNFIVS